ncbi:MAG TPA: hypothetical protein VF462_02195, partial [Micromonosporaceae bacterium]
PPAVAPPATAPPVIRSSGVPVRARATAAVPSPAADGRSAPRYRGTLYGGPERADIGNLRMSLPVRLNPENTGSLTGHILAQGWSDETPPARGTTARIVLALAVGLGVLIVIGLLVVVGLGGLFGTLMGGLLAG